MRESGSIAEMWRGKQHGAGYLEEGLRSDAFSVWQSNQSASSLLDGFKLVDEKSSFRASPQADRLGHIRASGGASSGSEKSSISDGASPAERAEFMRNSSNRLSSDISQIWDRRNNVLAIGDQHPTLGIKQFTIEHMNDFRKAGATSIGMEFLPLRSQPELDRYTQLRRDPLTKPEELAAAERSVAGLFHQAQDSPTAPEELRKHVEIPLRRTMDILNAAIDAGLSPTALEPNISRPFAENGGYSLMHEGMESFKTESQSAFDAYTNPITSPESRYRAKNILDDDLPKDWSSQMRREFFATLDEGRQAGLDFSGMKIPRMPESQDKLWNDRLHDLRNKTWARTTSELLSNHPDERMVLFAGAQHFQYEQRQGPSIQSVNERLQASGIGTTVLQFAGGDFAKPEHFNGELSALSEFYAKEHGLARRADGNYPPLPDSQQSAALRYTTPAQSAGVAHQMFAMRVLQEGPREADYVVHLPQGE